MAQVRIFCPACGWEETVESGRERVNTVEHKEQNCDPGCNVTLGYERL